MYRKIIGIFLMSFILFSSAGCKSSAPSSPSVTKTPAKTTEITVFIAASLKNSMEEIAKQYGQTKPDVKIVYNADSSGTLQTQIQEGAECDLFFSAAKKQMKTLDEGGYIDSQSITDLLENKVVLIKPKGGKTEVTSFETVPMAKNIALAGEDVPAGSYARQIFKNLGILDKVTAMEINQGANVTAVLAAVSEASNEIGVVYATDAASVADKVDILAEAPKGSLDSPVIYPAGLTKKHVSDDKASAAADFLTYLKSDAAAKVFEKYGFSKAK